MWHIGRRQDRQRRDGLLQDGAAADIRRRSAPTALRRGREEPDAEDEEPGQPLSTMDRALRYLGLAGTGERDLRRPPEPLPRTSEPREGAFMSARLSFRGEVSGEGDFHIAGRFEGEINVTGRVVVAQGAEVDANISGLAIVIGGTVRGNLSAATRVEILPTGVLTGSLKTGSFAAADGASVKGEVWVEPAATRTAAPDRKP
jgi:cytoskeletal protein CcmA (bactofilin family)